MVLPSIETSKAFGTGGLTPGGGLLSQSVEATDSAYYSLAVNLYIFSYRFLIYSISSLILGK